MTREEAIKEIKSWDFLEGKKLFEAKLCDPNAQQ